MKSKEMDLAHVEVVSQTSKRNRGSLVGRANALSIRSPFRSKVASSQDSMLTGPDIMKLKVYIAGLFATGYFALTPIQATGAPAGHPSAALSHGSEHYHYSAPYWGSSYSGYAGIYDSDYSYTPTPEQKTTAEQEVEGYLAAVKKGRKHACPPANRTK